MYSWVQREDTGYVFNKHKITDTANSKNHAFFNISQPTTIIFIASLPSWNTGYHLWNSQAITTPGIC